MRHLPRLPRLPPPAHAAWIGSARRPAASVSGGPGSRGIHRQPRIPLRGTEIEADFSFSCTSSSRDCCWLCSWASGKNAHAHCRRRRRLLTNRLRASKSEACWFASSRSCASSARTSSQLSEKPSIGVRAIAAIGPEIRSRRRAESIACWSFVWTVAFDWDAWDASRVSHARGVTWGRSRRLRLLPLLRVQQLGQRLVLSLEGAQPGANTMRGCACSSLASACASVLSLSCFDLSDGLDTNFDITRQDTFPGTSRKACLEPFL